MGHDQAPGQPETEPTHPGNEREHANKGDGAREPDRNGVREETLNSKTDMAKDGSGTRSEGDSVD
jgi:hypothetical protein